MTAKKDTPASKPESSASPSASGPFESLGRTLDHLPEVQDAEAAVRAAREELRKAQHVCAEIRQQASERVDHIREKNVGDFIADTLRQVSKRPALGVGVSILLGIVIGRISRR